jgi:hypothetical protein
MTEKARVAINLPQTQTEGRALLRMLEVGNGPALEIAWPSNIDTRSRLYQILRRCYGMQTALMRGKGELYIAKGVPGDPWHLNRDAISGFVRQPAGSLTSAERHVVNEIEQYHHLTVGAPVRVFPRAVDATLLGGLRRLIGRTYAEHELIRARYSLSESRVSIVNISVNDREVPGTIVLPRTACRKT